MLKKYEEVKVRCPKCGSNHLVRGAENMYCRDCGFFPIFYAKKVNQNEVSSVQEQKLYPT